MARVRGRAPLDVTWRLGLETLASWYRNEKRIDNVAVRPDIQSRTERTKPGKPAAASFAWTWEALERSA